MQRQSRHYLLLSVKLRFDQLHPHRHRHRLYILHPMLRYHRHNLVWVALQPQCLVLDCIHYRRLNPHYRRLCYLDNLHRLHRLQ